MTALTTPPSDLRVHDEPVTRPKRLARIAGGLYLLLAVLGGLAQLYVRPRAVVPADPAATAAIMSLNMLNHYSKRAASIGMPQAQGRWCGGSAERRSRRSPDRPGRSEPDHRCRSPVAGDGLRDRARLRRAPRRGLPVPARRRLTVIRRS